ncbi:MAG: FAD-binding protein [Neisseriaceae bacterium]|nr:MAG: FAD-binding protein [Neisseriaceae bacterium]
MPTKLEFFNNILPSSRIIYDELLRYAYATDASLYRMLPQLVLLVETEAEVIQIIQIANQHNIKLTFRAAGTSLSGQAVTDQVLVVLSSASWQKYQINSATNTITLQPGIIGAQANRYLAPYKRQIGPDPGSIEAAKIGGIIANNSSGMCCGTSKNSYATLQSMRAIFSDGSILDSSNPDQISKFEQTHHALITQISQIRDQIRANAELSQFIRKKFAIKNTSGYSLNAFIDYYDPIQIIERLLIGSEGTLAFISEVALQTIAIEEHRALNLIYGKLNDLINLTVRISGYDISSIELLDSLSLQSVAHIQELQPYLIQVDSDSAAIMVELTAASEELLRTKLTQVSAIIQQTPIIQQSGFVQDEKTAAILWKARKGVLPTIAGQRPLGSTVIIEDVAVQIEHLPALISDLRLMFDEFSYQNAAIFGHVLAGNIHFVITPNFTNQEELERYDRFMHAFTDLVANKYQGSLKAEHGSGRNIAPFALLEWGQQCWDIMWKIKELFDPQNILNPDVKLTRDNTLHMHSLKESPVVDPLIDKCMECGFCEPACPSRKFSLTPRQRNAVARKMVQLSPERRARWQKSYQYYAIDTCATTGMCQVSCPVDINTGEYIQGLKPRTNILLNHSKVIEGNRNKVQVGNFVAKIIGKPNLHQLTTKIHQYLPQIPVYLETMPPAQKHEFSASNDITKRSVTLIPTCPNRVFAANKNNNYPSQEILEKLGFSVNYLTKTKDTCCGQMYHSQCNSTMQQQSTNKLKQLINLNEIYIMDNSSCSGFAKDNEIQIYDINSFIANNLVDVRLHKKYHKIAVHIDCSSARHGTINNKVLEILQNCADKLIFPEDIKCCGFAGDKGFTQPELNQSSLSNLAAQISDCEIGVTFNRNCQIGLSYHGQVEYISFVELVLNCIK